MTPKIKEGIIELIKLFDNVLNENHLIGKGYSQKWNKIIDKYIKE